MDSAAMQAPFASVKGNIPGRTARYFDSPISARNGAVAGRVLLRGEPG
ncbi:MAG TPA: hypothetical protein VFW50_15980 [Streptosporangiaceae bacterium]|nr:hypothetical protein [Streptosporangiaceae bacterium]